MMEAQSAKLAGRQPRDGQPADLFEVNFHGLGQGRFTCADQLDFDSLHAWLEMRRTRPFGSSRIISLAATRFELQRYLRDHPRSRVADVAAAFAAGIGAISKSVDRLEARGWVTRLPNPTDGRSSLISLTTGGAGLTAGAERTFNDRLAGLIAPAVSASQVDAARTALAALRRAPEHASAGLPVG